jgi:hypothetical protein
VQEFFELSGLELNSQKCEVYLSGMEPEQQNEAMLRLTEVLPGLTRVDGEHLQLLGAPLRKEGVAPVLKEKKEAVALMTERLQRLSAHSALFLLTNCAAVPKLLYTLRTSAAWSNEELLDEIDTLIRTAVELITNVKMSDAIWIQASLPVLYGGLGIRRVGMLALPAFLASSHATEPLALAMLPAGASPNSMREEALGVFSTRPGAIIPPFESRGSQRQWDLPLVEHEHRYLMSLSDEPRHVARISAVSCKEAGRWLQALPSPPLGLHLDRDSLRVAVALRLGADICEPHDCGCGEHVDKFGLHGLSCRRSAGRHPRHHALNETIRRALVSAGIPSVLEPVGTSRSDSKRPDGATLIPWANGKPLLWDATCVDTLAVSNLVLSVQSAGSAAARAETRKETKYVDLLERFVFVPLGFETLGTFGPQCSEFLKKLGKLIATKTHEKRSTLYLQQRLSIEVQRGNAASIFGTLPGSRGLDEVFYIL